MPVDVVNSPKDGSRSVLRMVRMAIRVWRKMGSRPIWADATVNVAFVAALEVLEGLIIAFETLDDQPYEIDRTDGA